MANDFQLNDASSVAGLGTFSHTVVTAEAGLVTLAARATIPPGSGLQMVLKQNSTVLATIGGATANPTPTQQSLGTSVRTQAVAGDVMQVVLSSSNNVDTQPNAVKTNINFYQGY